MVSLFRSHCLNSISMISAQYQNLAVGQAAYQDSTWANRADHSAPLAVDGSPRATIDADYTCSHTGIDTSQPWWAVDLGRLYPITVVSILNRLDCCGTSYSAFQSFIYLNLCR